jgi:hypothetical protein
MVAPQEAYVRVVIDSIDPDDQLVRYHFETIDLPMGPDNVLYFRNCKQNQGFYVYYELDGYGEYQFPADTGEALWVTHGSKTNCPTTNQPPWGQFSPISVLDGNDGTPRRMLKVWNKNRVPAEFSYCLRITNGTDWKLVDPGGQNENRGMPFYQYLLSAGGVTGAVVGMGATIFLMNAFVPSAALLFGIGGAAVGLVVGFVLARM